MSDVENLFCLTLFQVYASDNLKCTVIMVLAQVMWLISAKLKLSESWKFSI